MRRIAPLLLFALALHADHATESRRLVREVPAAQEQKAEALAPAVVLSVPAR